MPILTGGGLPTALMIDGLIPAASPSCDDLFRVTTGDGPASMHLATSTDGALPAANLPSV
jgi:hypothetical protein